MNLIERTRARFQVAPFYGWYIVGALFFSMFLGVGARNGFGIFVETWEREFHASVATISIAAAVGWLVNGVSQVVFGRMVDRFGGRIVVTIGLIAMGLGTASIAAVGNVYALIALYGVVVSFASGALSGGPPSVVVARWFRKSRGRALSTLASGGSVGRSFTWWSGTTPGTLASRRTGLGMRQGAWALRPGCPTPLLRQRIGPRRSRPHRFGSCPSDIGSAV